MIVAITAYVPIPGHPRTDHEYQRLAAPLHMMALEVPLLSRIAKLENCWLHEYLHDMREDLPEVTHSVADNPRKNSLNYHIVQAQKSEFLVDAAEACGMRPDVYVWIDYGIFHIPGVTPDIIREFLVRADGEQTITIPGCWGGDYTYNDEYPCWRFCGGVMIIPRNYIHEFDRAMKKEYVRWIERTGNVSWEVNTLARLEKRQELPIWWYQADHDASIFTGYKTPEYADTNHMKNFRAQNSFFSGAN